MLSDTLKHGETGEPLCAAQSHSSRRCSPFGLLVVGCADGDTSTERQESQTGDLAAAGADDEARLNGTVRESAERRDQPDGNSEPQPVNPEPATVRPRRPV